MKTSLLNYLLLERNATGVGVSMCPETLSERWESTESIRFFNFSSGKWPVVILPLYLQYTFSRILVTDFENTFSKT